MKKKKVRKENFPLDELEELPTETEESEEEAAVGPEEPAEEVSDSTEDAERLLAEIASLREELEAKKRESERLFSEIAELALTFPYITLESITEEVWRSYREGTPLAAAYALYEKKRHTSEGYAREINERNAARSSGAIANSSDGGYYTPEEVRKMTPSEVKKNYRFIIESMKKWN